MLLPRSFHSPLFKFCTYRPSQTSYHLTMAGLLSAALCDQLLILVRGFGGVYFISLTTSVLCNYLRLPVLQAQSEIPSAFALVLFFMTAAAFCGLSLFNQLVQQSSSLEQTATILLIATSTASFVNFEYTDRWARGLYMVAIFVLGTWFLLCLWQKKTSFLAICLSYGLLCLIPAIHAIMSPRPNQPRIAHDFVKYSALNAIGGLTYCLQIPERISGLKSSSALSMNVCVVVAAIVFSGKLLAAHG